MKSRGVINILLKTEDPSSPLRWEKSPKAGVGCQPMIIGTNSMPTVILFRIQLGRKLHSIQNSSIVILHGCENSKAVRQPWGQAV